MKRIFLPALSLSLLLSCSKLSIEALPEASIEAAPTTIRAGEEVTLTVSSDGCRSGLILPIGVLICNGSVTDSPERTTTYIFSVDGEGGEVNASVVVEVLVKDSVVFAIDKFVEDSGTTETTLGSFEIPPHVDSLGVSVYVEVQLTGFEQLDESFAIGTFDQGSVEFITDEGCPVWRDDQTPGGWVYVGVADLPAATQEFIARHAVEFACYPPPNEPFEESPNSVTFKGIKFVYWRGE